MHTHAQDNKLQRAHEPETCFHTIIAPPPDLLIDINEFIQLITKSMYGKHIKS